MKFDEICSTLKESKKSKKTGFFLNIDVEDKIKFFDLCKKNKISVSSVLNDFIKRTINDENHKNSSKTHRNI